jgi:hypothetical protein
MIKRSTTLISLGYLQCHPVLFLDVGHIGEWAWSAIGLGLAFLVASLGTVGLGWYVMRADRLNRRYEVSEPVEEPSLDQ